MTNDHSERTLTGVRINQARRRFVVKLTAASLVEIQFICQSWAGALFCHNTPQEPTRQVVQAFDSVVASSLPPVVHSTGSFEHLVSVLPTGSRFGKSKYILSRSTSWLINFQWKARTSLLASVNVLWLRQPFVCVSTYNQISTRGPAITIRHNTVSEVLARLRNIDQEMSFACRVA